MALNYVRITKARVFILLVLTCLMMLLMTSSRTLSTSYLTMACQRMTSLSVTPARTQHVGDKKRADSKTADLSASTFTGADVIIETEDEVARRISKKVRVLVWVMTSNKSRDRAKTVKNTWGQRVHPDILLFVSSVHDPSLPTIALNVSEGRNHLTAKTMQAFDYVYENYLGKADFFMKVDDDTYVVMENLRYFLSHQDPNKPFVTGRLFKNLVKQGFNSGGAGYVLSRAALERLANRTRTPPQCKEDGAMEDVEIGRCLEKLGVPVLNSTDSRGGSRFHPYPPLFHVVGGLGKNYQYWDANLVHVGPNAINEYPITFHYIKPADMKLLDFYLYRIRPYGISHKYT